MSKRLKMRSVSEQDLGSIVKQMIDGALEDTEQLTKLQRVVYEEWYFKKMDEIKKTKNQAENHEKEFNNDLPNCEISNENQPDTNSCVHWKPPVIDNQFNELEEKCIEKNLYDFPTSNRTAEFSELELSHVECIKDIQKEECGEEAIAAPVVHTIRRIKPMKKITKIVRLPNTSDSDVQDNVSENYLVLRLKDCVRTSTNLTASHSTRRNLNEPLRETNEEMKKKLENSKSLRIQEDPQLIEVWKGKMNNVKNATRNDRNVGIDKSQKKETERTAAGEAAFEIWKKAKNIRYNRIFKKEQKTRQLEREEKLKEEERKREAYEACRSARKQRDAQCKLNSLRTRVMQEVKEAALREFHEKEIANDQAFKTWKRQKDNELKQRRMTMMTYNQQCYQQQTQMQRQIQGFDTFCVWLNQLDSVLHQKYLRERRHLVRSYYCQPTYYGPAAIST